MRMGRVGLVCMAVGFALMPAVEPAAAVVVDLEEFDEPPYSLGPESYYNGSDGAGGFTSQGAFFNNTYIDYGGGIYSWSGWSVSNITDNTTPGYDNQYSAYPGGGADGSEFYGVAYTFNPGDAYIDLPGGAVIESMAVTNTTYAGLSMLYGNAYAKQFGGPTGNDPDWFKLIITGLDEGGVTIGEVAFYLADYRFPDNSLDYIIDEWVSVDLASVSSAQTLSFGLESSDVGTYGMNTPAYFAMDNLTFIPEPGSAMLLLGGGAVILRRRRA